MLEELVGKHKLYTGGLRIQTTLNRKMQDAAAQAFQDHLTKLRKRFTPTLEGALLSIEGSTGQIKALIGGSDFQASQFNRALKARRQLGSTLSHSSMRMPFRKASSLPIVKSMSQLYSNYQQAPGLRKIHLAGLMA